LLHISTDYVFDGEKTGAYKEEDPVNPQSVYGQSKREGEEAVRQNLDQHIILRTSWVFGVFGKNFVYTMIRLARQKEELRIVNDQYGCPTAANAIARALVEISQRVTREGFDNWGTYHYCGQPETTWFHFAKTVIDATEDQFDYQVKHIHPIATSEYPTPAKRPKNSVLNCDKMRRIFGIEQANWQDDLKVMIQHQHFKDMSQ
jgi:dTDP-4-dehydrorhamnose reductase